MNVSTDRSVAILTPSSTVMRRHNLWQLSWQRFYKQKATVASLVLVLLVTLFVILVPIFAPYDYTDTDWGYLLGTPSIENRHYFGTDALGRDLFVRTAIGGRVSLMVGVAGATIAIVFGTIYGALSGYLGGKVDSIMMRFLDILTALPFMFFLILLVTLFGRNLLLIFVAIGLVSWLDVARIVRGQTISLKNKEFIEAAEIGGVSTFDIIKRHIIPNVIGVVVIYASLLVPSMILYESFISFLGLGVQEPLTSWGALLHEGSQTMQVAPLQILIPSAFLVTTLFCFNFIGDGLRDALDPKSY